MKPMPKEWDEDNPPLSCDEVSKSMYYAISSSGHTSVSKVVGVQAGVEHWHFDYHNQWDVALIHSM
jgi:hypothetical protein